NSSLRSGPRARRAVARGNARARGVVRPGRPAAVDRQRRPARGRDPHERRGGTGGLMAKAREIPGLGPDIALRDAAARTVQVRTAEVFGFAHGALDTTDIERVHDMRVA